MTTPDPEQGLTDLQGPGAANPPDRDHAAATRRFRCLKWLVLLLSSLVVLAVDQGTKHWAQHTLRVEHRGRITLHPSFLALNYVRNPGAAWGFLARSRESFRQPFFLTLSLAAMLFILYLHWRLEPGQHLLLYAISLVMGGAIGNFVDRLRLRYVIDFIELHWSHRFRWPTFNVADVAISLGVALLLFEMFFGPAWRRRRAARASSQERAP